MDTLTWMHVALREAEKSLKSGEVPVGCLFIYKDKVIATGSNTVNETRNATRHAEINCIDKVLIFSKVNKLDYKKVFQEVDVVVTVEPCIMCTSALYQLRVRSIIYGCANDRFGGCKSVFDVPKMYSSEITVKGGVEEEKAMSLLKEFYKGVNPNAPESKVKVRKEKRLATS